MAAVVLSVSFVGIGGWQLWERHRATSGTTQSIAPAVVEGQELDERRVPLAKCPAASDEPRLISLGSLGVKGCIQPVGTTNRKMQAPGNIHVAGWFTDSAPPGSDGLSIIDGHSSGRFKDGIFNRLGEFKDGSLLTVEYSDGDVKTFRVTSVRTHPVASTMKKLYRDARSEKANLALITCDGVYDASNHSYDSRTVVLAVNY